MAYQAVSTKCPNCGTPIDIDNPVCESCGTKLYITNYDTFFNMPQQLAQNYANAYREPLAARPNDGRLNLSAAMCFLRLHLYDQAEKAFERAMTDDMNNPELYFYAAVALLKGQRPFLAGRAAILKIEEYVNAALMIHPRGIYYYFLSYVKYDFYFNKHLRTSPTYQETLQAALRAGLTTREVQQLYATLGTAKPACL
ncbi:MAG: zinc-ribbon domain-containing protein [Clostridiales bacterium]|nr:zinc-ribbon domain-containing protein [Clostridiales bacterium]